MQQNAQCHKQAPQYATTQIRYAMSMLESRKAKLIAEMTEEFKDEEE